LQSFLLAVSNILFLVLLLFIWLIRKDNKILLQILIPRLNGRRMAPVKQPSDIQVNSLLSPTSRHHLNLPGSKRCMSEVVRLHDARTELATSADRRNGVRCLRKQRRRDLDVHAGTEARGAAAGEEHGRGSPAAGRGQGGAELAEVGKVVVAVVGEA